MTRNIFTRRSVLGGSAALGFWPGAAWPAPGEDRQLEGGIGGTGIVGILTEFGSLIVAGQRVELDTETRFTDGFGPIARQDLSIGDSLTVEAAGPTGRLTARRVHVTHPLVGTVSEADNQTRRIKVNGTEVELPPASPAVGPGDRVAISGLWRGVRVIASRVQPARPTFDLVAGTVERRGFQVRVSGVPVRGTGVQTLVDEGFGSVVGRYDPARGLLRAVRATGARFTGAAGPLERLAIEGYLEPVAANPGFRIAGLGHSFSRNLDLAPFAETRALFLGDYTGTFAARSALGLPEATEERARLLRRLPTW